MLLLQGGLACHKRNSGAERKAILLGFDGIDWEIIDQLRDAGELPNFERMITQGSSGVLTSIEPMFSPAIWTSIMTGYSPQVHGIRSFTVQTEKGDLAPVSSNMRRTKAIWNLLSEHNMIPGIVGFWVTYPPEEIRGYICSDVTYPLRQKDEGSGWPVFAIDANNTYASSVYPPGFFEEILPLMHTKRGEKEMELLLKDNILTQTGSFTMYFKDLSYHKIGKYLWENKHPRFLAVYYEGADMLSHWYWKDYRRYRQMNKGKLNPTSMEEKYKLFAGKVILNYYRVLDRYLGELMKLVDDDTLLMVVSDHGFRDYDPTEPIQVGDDIIRRGIYGWHSINGVIIAFGKGIRKGTRIKRASVLDITPTLLYYFGLPVARDMDGKVLGELFTKDFLTTQKLDFIDSYQVDLNESASFKPKRSPQDAERLELLKSLGYIQGM